MAKKIINPLYSVGIDSLSMDTLLPTVGTKDPFTDAFDTTPEPLSPLLPGGSATDLGNYYTKPEVDDMIDNIEAGTVDLSSYYTKSEVDSLIPDPVDLSGYYTKTDVDALLSDAVNQDDLTAETTARTAADETLQNNIDAEVTARTNADITLKNSIDGIKLVQDSGNTLHYTLENVDGQSLGEINIPKDQFLKSAEYDSTNKQLIFVFETTTGETTTNVDVSELVDTYTAGNGINITNNVISSTIELTDYYTKTETDVLLGSKADSTTVQTLQTAVTTLQSAQSATQQTLETEISDRAAADVTLQTAIDGKQNTLTAGDNITISGSTISATVPDIDLTDYYTKEEVDNKIASGGTFDSSVYYNKSDVDGLLTNKADTSGLTAETTARTNADQTLQFNIDGKQNVLTAGDNIVISGDTISAVVPDIELTDYYTKEEVDAAVITKVSLSGGTMTGDLFLPSTPSGTTPSPTKAASIQDVLDAIAAQPVQPTIQKPQIFDYVDSNEFTLAKEPAFIIEVLTLSDTTFSYLQDNNSDYVVNADKITINNPVLSTGMKVKVVYCA